MPWVQELSDRTVLYVNAFPQSELSAHTPPMSLGSLLTFNITSFIGHGSLLVTNVAVSTHVDRSVTNRVGRVRRVKRTSQWLAYDFV